MRLLGRVAFAFEFSHLALELPGVLDICSDIFFCVSVSFCGSVNRTKLTQIRVLAGVLCHVEVPVSLGQYEAKRIGIIKSVELEVSTLM